MAYTKPGVTVTYQQGTVSPNLTPPDLFAVVVGKGYNVRDIAPDSTFEDTYATLYDNDAGTTAVSLSGLFVAGGANVDSNSIYVDLLSGSGGRKILDPDTDFGYVGGVVTISGGLDASFDDAAIKIGYREQRLTDNSLVAFESVQDVEARIGKVDLFNPLTWGLSWALANAGLTVIGYGINSSNETTGHTNAITDFALDDDPYAITPMTNVSAIHSLYQTHVNAMSAADEKKERILIAGRSISWVDSDGTGTTGSDDASTDKAKTMNDIADAAFANGESRVFWVYPDVVYIYQTMHLSQIKRDYMNNAFGGAYGTILGEFAKLTKNITLNSGTVLYKGSLITDAVWELLKADAESDRQMMFDVLVPVPGFYMAASIVGQRSGLRPEQPLTNVPVAGPTELKYSGDFFSETQLNAAANGGTYWMWQKNLVAPVVSRHQLSTDRSSIQRQEMSIRSALDFCGKFVRAGVEPYIGRYTITPNFLKMLQMVVSAQGQYLVREGHLNSFSITTMNVDTIASDTILCTVEVGVKFPVNRIKFTLVF